MTRLERNSWRGLWTSMLLAGSAAIAVNCVILAAGWFDRPSTLARSSRLMPPDALIAGVWIVLFALMGAARWQAQRSAAPNARRLAAAIIGFMAWCLSYPFLTNGLSNAPSGLLANGITLGLNVALCLVLLRDARRAAIFMSLPIAWVGFASVGLLQETVLGTF